MSCTCIEYLLIFPKTQVVVVVAFFFLFFPMVRMLATVARKGQMLSLSHSPWQFVNIPSGQQTPIGIIICIVAFHARPWLSVARGRNTSISISRPSRVSDSKNPMKSYSAQLVNKEAHPLTHSLSQHPFLFCLPHLTAGVCWRRPVLVHPEFFTLLLYPKQHGTRASRCYSLFHSRPLQRKAGAINLSSK